MVKVIGLSSVRVIEGDGTEDYLAGVISEMVKAANRIVAGKGFRVLAEFEEGFRKGRFFLSQKPDHHLGYRFYALASYSMSRLLACMEKRLSKEKYERIFPLGEQFITLTYREAQWARYGK